MKSGGGLGAFFTDVMFICKEVFTRLGKGLGGDDWVTCFRCTGFPPVSSVELRECWAVELKPLASLPKNARNHYYNGSLSNSAYLLCTTSNHPRHQYSRKANQCLRPLALSQSFSPICSKSGWDRSFAGSLLCCTEGSTIFLPSSAQRVPLRSTNASTPD